jgi:sensor histidine kinase regulating citrate/malate metabolism
MEEKESTGPSGELIRLAMDCLDLSVSIIDPKGILLYYNRRSSEILDRKPEYINTDIHTHHQKATTNPKIDFMLQEFAAGRTEPFHYEANPYGKVLLATLIPLRKDGQLVGCVQTVRLKEEMAPEK